MTVIYFLSSWSCAVFKLHRGAVSQNFRWLMAKGKHLFPFRTEQLSLSAPMVLGGQPPGRVGRRRFFDSPKRADSNSGLALSLNPPRSARLSALQAESGGLFRLTQVVVLPGWRELAPGEGMRSGEAGEIRGLRLRACGKTVDRCAPRSRTPQGGTVPASLARLRRAADGLQPILAEGREVDHQVCGVGRPVAEVLFRIEHRFDSTDAFGRVPDPAGSLAFRAWRRLKRGPRSGPVSRRSGSGRHRRSASFAPRAPRRGIRPASQPGRR